MPTKITVEFLERCEQYTAAASLAAVAIILLYYLARVSDGEFAPAWIHFLDYGIFALVVLVPLALIPKVGVAAEEFTLDAVKTFIDLSSPYGPLGMRIEWFTVIVPKVAKALAVTITWLLYLERLSAFLRLLVELIDDDD